MNRARKTRAICGREKLLGIRAGSVSRAWRSEVNIEAAVARARMAPATPAHPHLGNVLNLTHRPIPSDVSGKTDPRR